MLVILDLMAVTAYPAHNYEILQSECVEKSRQNFMANKMRETKIIVNERLLGFYGFESSASAIITLDVSDTDVQLPKMSLSFTNLIVLHASNNGLQKIDDIGNETFPSLKFLNLSRNAITSIAPHVFSHLSEVEVLDLSHNCFVNFNYERVFLSHENLKKLYLHDNNLHTVHGAPGVSHILHLDMLDLRNNFIEKFDTFNLNVRDLQLRNNNLKSLTVHQGHSMALDASENTLTSFVSTGTFEHLNLSKNDFKYLTQVEIRVAKVLILSHNKMESTDSSSEDDDASDSSVECQVLDVSFNNISSMNDLKLFKTCELINLEGNQMKNLEFEKIRLDFPRVKRVNLRSNPLNEIDINEAKFHNDTRFLNIQFDYAVVEADTQELTLIPPIQLLFPTLPPNLDTTTSVKVTTTEQNTIAEELLERSDFLLLIYLPIFILFAASILAVIIYVIYGRHSSARFRFMNRKYNEAENPL